MVAPKLPMRIYPMPGRIIYTASTVFTGILSRVTIKASRSAMPLRITVRCTFVPFGPRRRRIISSRAIFTPAMAVSFTATMRSPAMMPTFSEGPPSVGCITMSVSCDTLNCMPTPSNDPCNGSFICFVSLAVVYDECGSSFSNIPRMPSSTSFCSSTESTYRLLIAISAICSLRMGLSSPVLMRS